MTIATLTLSSMAEAQRWGASPIRPHGRHYITIRIAGVPNWFWPVPDAVALEPLLGSTWTEWA